MSDSWLFVFVLILAGLLGYLVRRWFLVPSSPIRQWIDVKLSPYATKAFKVLVCAFLALWIFNWATADPDERTRLSDEFNTFMKSIEWGQKNQSPPDGNPIPLDQGNDGTPKTRP